MMSCSVRVYLVVSYSFECRKYRNGTVIVHNSLELTCFKTSAHFQSSGNMHAVLANRIANQISTFSNYSRTYFVETVICRVMLRYSGQLLLPLAADGISLARFRPIVKKKKCSLNAPVKSSVTVIETPFPLTQHVIWVLKIF